MIRRAIEALLRDLGPVEAMEVAETVPGVTTAGARPTLGQVFGKRVRITPGATQLTRTWSSACMRASARVNCGSTPLTTCNCTKFRPSFFFCFF